MSMNPLDRSLASCFVSLMLRSFIGVRSAFERQQDGELGATGLAFHFDQPIVLLYESLRERKAQSTPIFPPGNKRIENPVAYLFRDAGTVVSDMQVQCQFVQALANRHFARNTRTQLDTRIALRNAFAQRFRRVTHDVEQCLDKLFFIAAQVGHAHVVIAIEREATRKLRENHGADALAYFVNIHVANNVRMPVWLEQPVYQGLQPIRFLDDHLRVFAQLVAFARPQLELEQLRSASNTAKRILDFMREVANQLLVHRRQIVNTLFAVGLQMPLVLK